MFGIKKQKKYLDNGQVWSEGCNHEEESKLSGKQRELLLTQFSKDGGEGGGGGGLGGVFEWQPAVYLNQRSGNFDFSA